MYRLHIDRNSAVPAFKQVQQIIKLEILAGRLKTGENIPSQREMSLILEIHPNTVMKAYSILKKDGIITGKTGSGYYVSKTNVMPSLTTKNLLHDEFRKFVDISFNLGAGIEDIKELFLNYLDGENEKNNSDRD